MAIDYPQFIGPPANAEEFSTIQKLFIFFIFLY